MKKIIFLSLVFTIFISTTNSYAKNPQKIQIGNHKIFRYEFDLRDSDLILTKALDSGQLGLENVLSCSRRHNAKAAFNGSFFHTGYRKTGTPSFLFINTHNVFALNTIQDAIYRTKKNEVFFEKIKSSISLNLGNEKHIEASSINNPTISGIQIYTSCYWTSTLSDPNTYEILVKNNQVIEKSTKGNMKIPKDGFVISANEDKDIKILRKLKKGDFIKYNLELSAENKEININNISFLISGSNIIVKNAKVNEEYFVPSYKSDFRDAPHARTAICQLSKTKFAVFISDHNQALKVYDTPLREIITPLKKIGLDRETALQTTTGELLEKFNQIHKNTDLSVGMDLLTFANFLVSKNCINVINMDGGGSSTLVVRNKVINNPTGLENINVEGKSLRDVGDIFLITKKSK